MNFMNPLTRVFLVVALLVALVGGFWVINSREIARTEAQSICTNLGIHERDRGASNYDVESAIIADKADLLDMGYVCNDGTLTNVQVINVTSEMNPSASPATCDADGKLALPQVEHAKWENNVDGTWWPAQDGAGPGAYQLRLVPDAGYALDAEVEQTVTVDAKLTGDACTNPEPTDNLYECRTSGLNNGPEFVAFQPDKLGNHSYGRPFTARTIKSARKSIYDQGFCDPVWMMQKYREYVDPGMRAERADKLAHELIAQAKAGENERWDGMLDEIMAQFDRAKNSFGTIPAGTYHSLGVLTNTKDGVPRVVDFIVDDNSKSTVLRSVVRYKDGTVRTLNLRTECDLQLRTNAQETPTGPAKAPKTAAIPRDREGSPADKEDVCRKVNGKWVKRHNVVKRPGDLPIDSPECSNSSPSPSASPSPSSSPTPSASPSSKKPSEAPTHEPVDPTVKAEPSQAQPTRPAPAPTAARANPDKPRATTVQSRDTSSQDEGGDESGSPDGP